LPPLRPRRRGFDQERHTQAPPVDNGKAEEMGAEIEDRGDAVLIRRTGRLRPVNLKTMPYPGFPTDMLPQLTACLSLAEGTSMVTETVSDNRYKFVGELSRMGADIQVDGKTAVVKGVGRLSGSRVRACDLRAGSGYGYSRAQRKRRHAHRGYPPHRTRL
jgi:UDP-N-acetylglucosamine enolpyruvyl transferase